MPGASNPRLQPLPGYNFSVRIEKNTNGAPTPLNGDNYFSKISGISTTRNTNPIQAGAGNMTTYHLPTEITYSPLVLERGIVAGNSPLTLWCTNSMAMAAGIQTATIIVHLMEPNTSTPAMTWAFFNAYPTKWTISDFDAMDSKYTFESIEFCYSYYTRIL
jgi:phage tail-like protein